MCAPLLHAFTTELITKVVRQTSKNLWGQKSCKLSNITRKVDYKPKSWNLWIGPTVFVSTICYSLYLPKFIINKFRQIQTQIYKYRHVSLPAAAWSAARLQNVNKGHLRSVLMSLCTNRNFFLCDCTPGCTFEFCCHILGKPKQILLSRWKHFGELVIDVRQARGKRHWRVEILCSTGLSPYLVIKDVTDMVIKKCSSYAVTMKMCDNEKSCQGRYSETSVLC